VSLTFSPAKNGKFWPLGVHLVFSMIVMGLIFRDEPAIDPKTARIWAFLFACAITVLALIGILAIVLLLHDEIGSGFRMPRQMAMGLLSAAVVCCGLIFLLFGVRAKKQAIEQSLKKVEEEKPWLRRKDWAAGRIVTASKQNSLLLWIIVFFWCAASFAISLVVVPGQLMRGNHAALIALVFPVIGVALILFACRTTFAWRRFSKSIFEPKSVPTAAGGVLQGEIQFPGTAQPEHGWHLALSCIRRTVSGPINNLRTTEKILWQDEKWLRPDLPKKNPGTISLPVFFPLPGDKPESSPDDGNGTIWRLEAWGRFPGPDFRAEFEVPVFKLDEPHAVSDDPTLLYQVSLDEIRKQTRSKIQITDLADGKEFIFPAGRNPGFAAGATVIWLIWTAIVVVMACLRAPLPVPLIFGAMDLLMLYFVLDLWFRRSRVTISAEKIKVETGWSGVKKNDTLKISEAAKIFVDIGMPVGHLTYYDLKLRARDGKELLLAKNLGHKPEADWLARQMTAVARNVPVTDSNA
jgi:hypothetical protein